MQAVIDHQADAIVGNQRRADLGTVEGIRAWRDMVVDAARGNGGKGGCPLGSLGGQLAETDDEARALIAAGFDRWSAAIGDGLRARAGAGLPAGVITDDLAVTLLAAVQGGLLLAQVPPRHPPARNRRRHPPRPRFRRITSNYGCAVGRTRISLMVIRRGRVTANAMTSAMSSAVMASFSYICWAACLAPGWLM